MIEKTSRALPWITPLALIGLGAFGVSCTSNNAGGDEASDDFLGGAPPLSTVVDYEDFSDGGGYGTRWFGVSDFLAVGEPSISSGKSFVGGQLAIGTNRFSTTYDVAVDHMKYLAVSTTGFNVPLQGSVMVSADMRATNPGAIAGRRSSATGKRLLEGQQGAATLSLIDPDDTGIHLSWWVSEHKAFALYERLFPDGVCALSTGFTQIIDEYDLSPGTHNFSIEYRRNTSSRDPDMVRFLIDGTARAWVSRVGIPLDQATPSRPVTTFPSQGPGEELKNRLNTLVIGHGVGTMLDVFPFNQCSTGIVSVPASERAFGQGVNAVFDNIRVTTVTPGR